MLFIPAAGKQNNTISRVCFKCSSCLFLLHHKAYMLRKLFTDPSFLFLLAANFYCLYYYENKDDFETVVWIYWLQSITIGFFTFLELLTIKNYDTADFTMNDQPVTSKNKGCSAWFFLVHYGIFHFVYGIFLLVKHTEGLTHPMILLIGFAGFLMEGIIGFRKRKEIEPSIKVSIGTIFFLPYLRVVPMHLMILGPAFLGWQPGTIFLVLKILADIISYIVYRAIYSKPAAE
jgi:Family of unknown function (DUF6498)